MVILEIESFEPGPLKNIEVPRNVNTLIAYLAVTNTLWAMAVLHSVTNTLVTSDFR